MHEQNGWWYKHYQLSTIIPFMYTHIYVCICIYLYVIPYVSNKPHIIWNLPEPTKNPAFQELLCWRLLNAGFSVFFLCLCSKHHGFSFCWGNSSGNWRITLKIYWDNIIYIYIYMTHLPTVMHIQVFCLPPSKNIYIYIYICIYLIVLFQRLLTSDTTYCSNDGQATCDSSFPSRSSTLHASASAVRGLNSQPSHGKSQPKSQPKKNWPRSSDINQLRNLPLRAIHLHL